LIWIAPGVTTPDTVCEQTIDFMRIDPTLVDLAGLEKPAHLEEKSIRSLLQNPQAPWDDAAVTTYEFKNRAVRTEGWRYIRYENGDKEQYDESKAPYEWTNLADVPEFARRKAELARFLPTSNKPDLSDSKNGPKVSETR
jgi:arylsulfatase A-like enzyme